MATVQACGHPGPVRCCHRPAGTHLFVSASRRLHSALVSRPFCDLLTSLRCQPHAPSGLSSDLHHLHPRALPGLPAPSLPLKPLLRPGRTPSALDISTPCSGVPEPREVGPLPAEAWVPPLKIRGSNPRVTARQQEMTCVQCFINRERAERARAVSAPSHPNYLREDAPLGHREDGWAAGTVGSREPVDGTWSQGCSLNLGCVRRRQERRTRPGQVLGGGSVLARSSSHRSPK